MVVDLLFNRSDEFHDRAIDETRKRANQKDDKNVFEETNHVHEEGLHRETVDEEVETSR